MQYLFAAVIIWPGKLNWPITAHTRTHTESFHYSQNLIRKPFGQSQHKSDCKQPMNQRDKATCFIYPPHSFIERCSTRHLTCSSDTSRWYTQVFERLTLSELYTGVWKTHPHRVIHRYLKDSLPQSYTQVLKDTISELDTGIWKTHPHRVVYSSADLHKNMFGVWKMQYLPSICS